MMKGRSRPLGGGGRIYGRSENADGDRPETSEAQGQRAPLAFTENRPRQKHLNPQKSVRDLGMNPQSQECDGRSRDAPDGTPCEPRLEEETQRSGNAAVDWVLQVPL